MAAKWKIDDLQYYLSKESKNKVVYKVKYSVSDSKVAEDKTYSANLGGSIILETDVVEAAEAKDAVLYTDKDTLLADKAVKVGDIKTPAVKAVKAKDPWASVDFVEYDKLTEDVVIGWVKTELGEDIVKVKEDTIAAKIDEEENPPAATEGNGVPW